MTDKYGIPDNLLTCFNPKQLPIYQKAVAEYAKLYPKIKLVISTDKGNNQNNDPALYLISDYCDLTEFWQLYEQIKKQS